MPEPVRFTCSASLPQSPDEIGDGILDLARWSEFKGWGPIPGIRSAEFVKRTQGVVGTVIATVNTDGSRHREEILEWDLPRRITLRLFDFPRPLRFMAREFRETWLFTPGEKTHVSRAFELHPRNALTRPALLVVRSLLRRAIRAQLAQLASSQTPS